MTASASTQQPRKTESRRSNCFDFLRFLAAFAVVVQHGTYHFDLKLLWLEPNGRWWFYDGVPLFFILSGMLVYRSAEKCILGGHPVRDYFTNRFLRIAPAIYTYLVVTVIVLLALGAMSWRSMFTLQFAGWSLATILLAPIYNPPMFRPIGLGAINGSLWTIPVEIGFYAMVPIFVWAARRSGFARTMSTIWGFALISMTVLWWLGLQGMERMPYKLFHVTFLAHLGYFALGMCWSKLWAQTYQSGWLAALCAALYVLVRIVWLGPKELSNPLETLAWAIPLSYAAIWFAYHGPRLLGRWTEKVGDLSFGVYIWHGVVLNVMLYLGVKESAIGRSWMAHALLIVGTLAMASASWWFVEKRALQLKPYSSRPDQAAPAIKLKEAEAVAG
ncbi:MAG: acyltransferase [Acidobacteriales bacterium]|nr:acyltransferase [Terriglobales bacterium]